MRRFRIWLGCLILPRDWRTARAAKTMTVKIEADTKQFDTSIRRATAQVRELLDLTERLPR